MTVPTVQRGNPRRLTLIAAMSTVIGLVSAVSLVVGPAAGAPEPVITGSTLIAFAFGWACLAGLSTRFTSQPQRWAFVPAASLAVVGLGLIATAPRSDAIDMLGWVWPPALLILVGWMALSVRRHVAGRTRWLVYPLVGALALSSVGGAVETILEQGQHGTLTATGQLVDIGGRRMHIECTGTGSPTVVLQSGAGEASYYWARIASAVSATTRVCAYDRAGHGGSDPSTASQDGNAVAADLHALLAASGIAGPYILVGHSTGGPFIRIFAATYPAEVAGMVFLDAQPADAFTALPQYAGMYPALAMVTAITQPFARVGVMRLANGAAFGDLPEPARAAQQAYQSSGRAASALRDDFAAIPATLREALALTTIGSRPLVVVTAAAGAQAGWVEAQRDMLALSTDSASRVAQDQTHDSLIMSETGSAFSTRAILDVLESARTGLAVATR